MAKEYSFINKGVGSSFSRGSLRLRSYLTEFRKAKDYTYLYGSSFDDSDSALTRHLKTAFDSQCEE